MFKWLKKWFCKPQEQTYSFIHILYEIEGDEDGKVYIKKARKPVRAKIKKRSKK